MLVCALRSKQRTCKHTDKTESAQIIRIVWACLRYPDSNKRENENIRFKRLCLLYAFPVIQPNLALFAIHENSVTDPNQPYLSRPFSPYAIKGKCAKASQISPCRNNWPSMDLTQNKETVYLDSDIPKLEALQRFKLYGQIRNCAILQQSRNAITMSCIRRFCVLNPLFPLFNPMRICLYTLIRV